MAEGWPSFSLILETENLASANLEGFSWFLASLMNQDLPLSLANEILIIDSGDAPATLLQELQRQYPGLKVCQAASSIDYYSAKMLGAELASGEIIVYCDSDCLYEQSWLRHLLSCFDSSGQINVVGGETAICGVGPYRTTMALVYIFPPYSGREQLTSSQHYFLNNVAFRREFLLAHPLPLNLPLYRGHCVIHARQLCQAGFTVWSQPRSQASHAPPHGRSQFFWRFLLIGHDAYWQRRLLSSEPQQRSNLGLIAKLRAGWQVFWQRSQSMLLSQPKHLLFLPLAIPIVVAALLLMAIAYLVTWLRPHALLTAYNNLPLPVKPVTPAPNPSVLTSAGHHLF